MNDSKIALVIIDMINDFQFKNGKILAEKAKILARNISSLKAECSSKKIPVIYINDHYKLWQANLNKILEYCTNPISSPILQYIQPHTTDYFLIKPKHSIFYGTALTILLQQLNVKTLILTGLAGNICVLFSANDAYMREYNLIIPKDCIASNSDEDNKFAIEMMQNVLKANICEHSDLIT
ncbi:cysteine hydrolase [Priestia flexa]|jgi:nicotinamidase-related amidase|uniref:Cysteine hydrolase n=1 Tax=Priestia flexa TaxID=86664 RepID=A0A1N7BP26_9BACI|nr:isochorismatase family cysteine hydrolase [Priestia flexa]AQX52988.1 isochorismatase [Priestia flexa]MBN8253985.1 cysteine hydrolase [Priestia flexa]MBN8436372.1 cysteine hydrolase [Priestia flexa]MBY6088590.1 cysteine hydrolase [Priestia flexa]MCA0968939.1 cysteine hydrolase [Priestia flexa]